MPEESSTGMVQFIAELVSTQYRIPVEDIFRKDRHKGLVEARQMVAYLARTVCKMSYPEIGRALGNRDHTTIMQGTRSFHRKLAGGGRLNDNLEHAQGILKERFLTLRRPGVGLCISINEQVQDRLLTLVESGCFGDSIAEAAERIISMYVFERCEGMTEIFRLPEVVEEEGKDVVDE